MSRKSLLISIAAVSLIFFSCGRILDTVTPWIITDAQETSMGANFYGEIVKDTAYPLYTKNAGLVSYIRGIGDKIVASQNDRPENSDFKYQFDVIDKDSVVNAFAIPGGHMFVYTGLILAAQNEAEIAGVMAHEVAHITKRHGAKRLVESSGMSFVLDLVLGDSTALRSAMNIATGLLFLKFSRVNEEEADSCSIKYSIASGYNPYGMEMFFQYIGTDSSFFSKMFEPLSTHPRTVDRIAAVDAIIKHDSQADTSQAALFTTRFLAMKDTLKKY